MSMHNTINPIYPEEILTSYKKMRAANPERDKNWSALFDCIMNNICEQAKIHLDHETFNKVWPGSIFPERVSCMCLRAMEEYLTQNIADANQFKGIKAINTPHLVGMVTKYESWLKKHKKPVFTGSDAQGLLLLDFAKHLQNEFVNILDPPAKKTRKKKKPG